MSHAPPPAQSPMTSTTWRLGLEQLDVADATLEKFERGVINGVDVSGLSFISVCHIPGNVLAPGSWQVVSFVDDRASNEQYRAILDAYHGRLGGPLADLAGLVSEVIAIERAPIIHETRDGKGTLRIGEVVSAEMEPFRSPDGATVTTLHDSLFSTVPGSPAYVARAHHHTVNPPADGGVGFRAHSDLNVVPGPGVPSRTAQLMVTCDDSGITEY